MAIVCPSSSLRKKKKQRKNLLKTPYFLYHPDPLATGSFVGRRSQALSILWEKQCYYALMPYCIEEMEHLCPTCIANGQAAKIRAEFVRM